MARTAAPSTSRPTTPGATRSTSRSRSATEKQGWTTVNNIMTPLGTPDFSQFLTAAINSDADVLVLNHYGKDMVNSLTQAVQFGMRDMQKNGKDMQIVVPLYSRAHGPGRGRQHRGRARHHQLERDARRRRLHGLRQGVPPTSTASRRPRRPRPAMCRPCCTPTPRRPPAPSIRRRSSRRWRASTSTAPARQRNPLPRRGPPVLPRRVRGGGQGAAGERQDEYDLLKSSSRSGATTSPTSDLDAFGGPKAELGPYEPA